MDDRTSLPSPEEVADLRLPETAREVVGVYDRRVGDRPRYLWKWLYEVFPRYRLSSVPDRHGGTVREGKLLLTVYYTLLDDLADLHGDRATFLEARKLALPRARVDSTAGVDTDYLSLARLVWEAVEETLWTAPRAGEFESTFQFDLEQVLNAMHYGMLVNERPPVATETGTATYSEHNMAQFSYADLDIMFSPGFSTADLRPLREVVWTAQRLARISNWVATWEREVGEGDPTSGVVVYALQEGVVDLAELEDPAVSGDVLVNRIREAGVEQRFLEEWDRLFDRLRERSHDTESVDLDAYVAGMDEMRQLYLDSRGRI